MTSVPTATNSAGRGRGRGAPVAPLAISAEFPAVSSAPVSAGRGRGRGIPTSSLLSTSPSGAIPPEMPRAPQLPSLAGPAHPHNHSNTPFHAKKTEPGYTSGLGISMSPSELEYRSHQTFKANSATGAAGAGAGAAAAAAAAPAAATVSCCSFG